MRKVGMVLAAGLAALAGGAQARSTGQARLAEVGDYITEGVACRLIGYQFNDEKNKPTAQAALDEAIADGMSSKAADYYLSESLDRGFKRVTLDIQAQGNVVKQAIDDPEFAKTTLRSLLVYFVDSYGRRCDEAAGDRLFSAVIVAPPPAVLAAAKADYIDERLADARVAPWQTRHVLAQAEVLFAVGACRSQLPPADFTRYTAITTGPEPTDPAQARTHRYYSKQLKDGLASAEELALDKAQCGKVMAGRLAELKAAP